MRANRIVAGKFCPACMRAIELGDPVVNCQECGMTSHEHCYASKGGCANTGCRKYAAGRQYGAFPSPTGPPGPAPAQRVVEDLSLTVPCPYCGEGIYPTAKKCRFCNEFLDESLRISSARAKQGDSDENMSPFDIILCLLCPGIGCIAGLVYGVQGKSKGWKMMGLGVVMWIVWAFVNAAIMGGQQ